MWACVRLALLFGVAGALLLSGEEAGAAPGTTQRVSVDSGGNEANSDSLNPAVSADGHYVAFESSASDLVQQDTNGRDDIFVRDRQMAITERASVSTAGVQGNSDSLHAAISDDGHYVTFDSNASNLVSGDTNVRVDVFVRDRQAGTTERVSLSSGGVEGNDTSWYPAISGDGRFVAYQSFASNLVSGDTNNVEDVFVRDRQAATTTRVSLATGGTQGNGSSGGWIAVSGDGRYVAFTSDASNLVTGDTLGYGDVFVRDRDTDTDGIFDEAGSVSTTRVSVDSAGTQANGESYYAAISSDGRHVAFGSAATNLVTGDTNVFCDTDGDTQYDDNCPDVFVRDRQAETTTRVSLDSTGAQGNGGSFDPSISPDGRYVAFRSVATNLVSGDSNGAEDVFLRDRDTDTDGTFDEDGAVSTTRVSVASGGAQGDGASSAPAVSSSGHYIAFDSEATNLVPGDTNVLCQTDADPELENCPDIFVNNQLGSVGGIAELPEAARDVGRREIDGTLLAGAAAVALALLASGAWYVRRRSGQARS